jgi:hypothetical protein
MSTDEKNLESRLRMSAALTQMVNMTRRKMEADLLAYYDRVEAATSTQNVETKEGSQVITAACLALRDRLKAWQAEFQQYVGGDSMYAECGNIANKVLSDIREKINEIVDIHNEAAQRRIAAIHEQERRDIHEQERRDIEEWRRDMAAITLEHQKRVNKMNRDFAERARAIRRR